MTFLLELQFEIEADSFPQARRLAETIARSPMKSAPIRLTSESMGIVDTVFTLPPEKEE